jgi:hypothetical protein
MVRINLSGLSMELLLRAIMGIRAHRACLDFRPHRTILKPGLRCAGQPFVHPVTSFSRTSGEPVVKLSASQPAQAARAANSAS